MQAQLVLQDVRMPCLYVKVPHTVELPSDGGPAVSSDPCFMLDPITQDFLNVLLTPNCFIQVWDRASVLQ
jgi:hypothetical protein